MTKQNSFTLIELLVVVAIISVLIALLLPALSKARNEARKVTCLTNFHQIGMGVQMYSDRYGEWAPWAPNGQAVWTYTGGSTYTGYIGLGLLWSEKFVSNGDIFQCTEKPGFTDDVRYYVNYPKNGIIRTLLFYVPTYPRTANPISVRDRFRTVSNRALLTEEPINWFSGWWTPNVGIHQTGNNVLYGDGSASFRRGGKPTNGSMWADWHTHELDRFRDN
jgi:prepilin-type N-terminal cleavage/methylation domain-containing protein/prepilin-type processing-associated H-X9-DG protein